MQIIIQVQIELPPQTKETHNYLLTQGSGVWGMQGCGLESETVVSSAMHTESVPWCVSSMLQMWLWEIVTTVD
jgi:hypothetical protein